MMSTKMDDNDSSLIKMKTNVSNNKEKHYNIVKSNDENYLGINKFSKY